MLCFLAYTLYSTIYFNSLYAMGEVVSSSNSSNTHDSISTTSATDIQQKTPRITFSGRGRSYQNDIQEDKSLFIKLLKKWISIVMKFLLSALLEGKYISKPKDIDDWIRQFLVSESSNMQHSIEKQHMLIEEIIAPYIAKYYPQFNNSLPLIRNYICFIVYCYVNINDIEAKNDAIALEEIKNTYGVNSDIAESFTFSIESKNKDVISTNHSLI